MTRVLLLRLARLCARRLPPEWREAALAEAECVLTTRELACWTLGLARIALSPLWRREWSLRRR